MRHLISNRILYLKAKRTITAKIGRRKRAEQKGKKRIDAIHAPAGKNRKHNAALSHWQALLSY